MEGAVEAGAGKEGLVQFGVEAFTGLEFLDHRGAIPLSFPHQNHLEKNAPATISLSAGFDSHVPQEVLEVLATWKTFWSSLLVLLQKAFGLQVSDERCLGSQEDHFPRSDAHVDDGL